MKIDWQYTKSITDRDMYIYTPHKYVEYQITNSGFKIYSLFQNQHYIGAFSTLKKAQKVVELIEKG